MSRLDELRVLIDQLDGQIAPLLARRMALSEQIGRLKAEEGLPVSVPERERSLLAQAIKTAEQEQPGTGAAVGKVYRAIFAFSRELQGKLITNTIYTENSSDCAAEIAPLGRIIDVTRELLSTPPYPGDPCPEAVLEHSFAMGDCYNLTRLSLSAHNATHVDAPRHFIDGGADIAALPPEPFVGRCVVIKAHGDITAEEVEGAVNGHSRLLIKGGVVTEEAAHAMVRHGLRLVGVDGLSVGPVNAPAAVHRILLGAGIVLLEGLELSAVSCGEYLLLAQPLKIAGSDGAPCRALLVEPVPEPSSLPSD